MLVSIPSCALRGGSPSWCGWRCWRHRRASLLSTASTCEGSSYTQFLYLIIYMSCGSHHLKRVQCGSCLQGHDRPHRLSWCCRGPQWETSASTLAGTSPMPGNLWVGPREIQLWYQSSELGSEGPSQQCLPNLTALGHPQVSHQDQLLWSQ